MTKGGYKMNRETQARDCCLYNRLYCGTINDLIVMAEVIF